MRHRVALLLLVAALGVASFVPRADAQAGGTTVKIPSHWLSGNEEGALTDLQAYLAGRGATVVRRTRGGQWVRLQLAQTLSAGQQAALTSLITTRLNSVQYE